MFHQTIAVARIQARNNGAVNASSLMARGFTNIPLNPERMEPQRPEDNPLYAAGVGHLETFLAPQRERDRKIPGFAEGELRSFLECGILAYGVWVLRTAPEKDKKN